MLNLYVPCMYVFRDGHLVLDNQLVCSSERKTTYPRFNIFFYFPIVILNIYLSILHPSHGFP